LQLRNAGLGVLLISSELDELLKLSDRLYVMFDGKVAAEFPRAQFERGQIGRAMTGARDAH
jgi:simple sugar transport system ATP-binding protein